MRDFRTLKVWQKAHELTLSTYRVTMHLPDEERFGLCSQMRRAAASIPTNIAEGCGRNGNAELARFLWIAIGSASELEYQFLLCHDLHLLDVAASKEMCEQVIQVRRMLYGFVQTLAEHSK